MNLSESLGWMKTLKQRHGELVALRDGNAHRTISWGRNTDSESREVKEPVYDVKKLDRRVTLLAREIRMLDEAIKRTNAVTEVVNYTRRDDVLGELEE